MTQPLTAFRKVIPEQQVQEAMLRQGHRGKYLVPWRQLCMLVREISSHKTCPFCRRQSGTEIETERLYKLGETCRQSIMTRAQFCL